MNTELNAKVAEKVMGWKWRVYKDSIVGRMRILCFPGNRLDLQEWDGVENVVAPRNGSILGPPDFTGDASADYLVLKHVRETWDIDGWAGFTDECLRLVRDRLAEDKRDPGLTPYMLFYEPGDYARAAVDYQEASR